MKLSRLPPSQLVLLLLFELVCLASAIRVADAARPGFLYTRKRGRCTPQRFWSSRRQAWPRMVPQAATVSNVFGSRALNRYRYDLTLAESAARNDKNTNTFGMLVKESTAALINSYTRRKSFPYCPWEVKTMLIQGLVSERAALVQARLFSRANEACG